MEEFVRNRRWINDPSLLWEPLAEEEIKDETYQVDKGDPEVKKEKSIKVNAAKTLLKSCSREFPAGIA